MRIFQKKMTLIFRDMLFSPLKSLQLTTKKMILWSNFISWHEVLNRLWEGVADEDERYEDIFQLKRQEKPGTIQGITTRLHKDWIKRVT